MEPERNLWIGRGGADRGNGLLHSTNRPQVPVSRGAQQ